MAGNNEPIDEEAIVDTLTELLTSSEQAMRRGQLSLSRDMVEAVVAYLRLVDEHQTKHPSLWNRATAILSLLTN